MKGKDIRVDVWWGGGNVSRRQCICCAKALWLRKTAWVHMGRKRHGCQPVDNSVVVDISGPVSLKIEPHALLDAPGCALRGLALCGRLWARVMNMDDVRGPALVARP